MNYENVTDPRNGMHLDDDLVADCMIQLATIWLLKPPVDDDKEVTKKEFDLAEEAEDFAWKACNITDRQSRYMVLRVQVFVDVFLK
jgi:hypothetical protein